MGLTIGYSFTSVHYRSECIRTTKSKCNKNSFIYITTVTIGLIILHMYLQVKIFMSIQDRKLNINHITLQTSKVTFEILKLSAPS